MTWVLGGRLPKLDKLLVIEGIRRAHLPPAQMAGGKEAPRTRFLASSVVAPAPPARGVRPVGVSSGPPARLSKL